MSALRYEEFLRSRITQLRIQKDVSEHRMSLDLGKSGSYIRGITSGASLPSIHELFHIFEYFNVTPTEFFQPMTGEESPYMKIMNRIRTMRPADLEKVSMFIEWIS